MYHHVNPEGNFINVKPQIFENHIRYLNEHGFTALHTNEFLAALNCQQMPHENSVMITFDDGWLDNWIFAFPVLKRYGMKAVIFVITSLIPEKGKRQRVDEGTAPSLPSHKECNKIIEAGHSSDVMISWEELRETVDSGLIEIQSHTHTHRRYDRLYNDSTERIDILKQDLKISKKIIEEKSGRRCNALCWPWGIYDKDYVDVAKSLGYRVMFTTEKGTNTPITEPWRVKRLGIGNISLLTLRKKLFIHSRDWLSRVYLKIFK